MKFNRISAALAALVLVLAVSLTGCGSDAPEEPAETPVENGATMEPAPDPGEASAGDSEQLTRTECSRCHTYDRVEAAKKDRAGWESTVDRMIQQNNAALTDEQRQSIVDYLAERDQ